MARRDITRRGLLRGMSVAAAGLPLPAVLRASPDEPIVIGVNAAQSGPFAPEGGDELKGARLAAAHVNGEGDGGLLTSFTSDALDRAGLLGRRMHVVDRDSRARADLARAGARSMIESDGAVMITGASSSGAAIATQQLCQEAGAIYMCGLSHANATTGVDRSSHGFRHFLNCQISASALAPALKRLFGPDRRAHHLMADNGWGREQQAALAAASEARGWTTVNADPTPVATTDFRPYLRAALASGADVLVLNLYGGNLVSALRQAAELGVRGRKVDGRPVEIVAPLMTELVADKAGPAVEGVVASQNWSPKRQEAASRTFVRSFEAAYGHAPSQAAHTCYVQTLLYADAVARADSLEPCTVARALEGFRFDGLGDGPSLYRGADHQCFKEALVVRGEAGATPLGRTEIVEASPAGQTIYPSDHPMFRGGRLGSCTRQS